MVLVDDDNMLSQLFSQFNTVTQSKPVTNVSDMPTKANTNYTPTKKDCTSTNTVPSNENELPVNDKPTITLLHSIKYVG